MQAPKTEIKHSKLYFCHRYIKKYYYGKIKNTYFHVCPVIHDNI